MLSSPPFLTPAVVPDVNKGSLNRRLCNAAFTARRLFGAPVSLCGVCPPPSIMAQVRQLCQGPYIPAPFQPGKKRNTRNETRERRKQFSVFLDTESVSRGPSPDELAPVLPPFLFCFLLPPFLLFSFLKVPPAIPGRFITVPSPKVPSSPPPSERLCIVAARLHSGPRSRHPSSFVPSSSRALPSARPWRLGPP